MTTLAHTPLGVQLPDAAIAYAMAGFAVFPLKVGSKEPLARSHGLLEATIDLRTIEAWWDREPRYNIGINCGRSGLLVIDVDPRNGGTESYYHWKEEHGSALPDSTLLVATPGGGYHYYYYVGIGNVPRKRLLCKGVDLQGDGAYVVAPPSELLAGSYQVVPRA